MADDLTRPFVGYRSAGRRPESQQDRRAAADAPLSALRGMVSGVLGAPGDIESLIRMLPGLSERTVLPTSEDVEKRLPMRELNQTPTGRAFTTAGQLGGGFYTGPGSPLRAIAALPSAVSRAGRDFLMSTSPVHVVKPKGGNWLAGSVERAVEPMKARDRFGMTDPQDLAAAIGVPLEEAQALHASNLPNVAINRWLEQKLGKYIRNEMATPEDPVRALAERGVLHVDPDQLNFRPELHGRFMSEGQTAVAQSPAAKSWEGASDLTVGQMPAGQLLQQGYAEQMPWLAKVPPETPVYMPSQSGMADDLGFGHLVDELRNAINPESGLPAALSWKYQDLDKVTVPQAVERVAKINEWRAAQKAEADMARAMGPATQVIKEYPEQGFKWVELRQPEPKIPEGSVFEEYNGMQRLFGPNGESLSIGATKEEATKLFKRQEREKMLEDALKYEGETMGHCVGGYCPDVVEGRSKIYSLRDKKGQPHVTIEVRPASQRIAPRHEEILAEMKASGVDTGALSESAYDAAYEQALQRVKQSRPPEIVQIKGKGNKAPKEEYLPAVQDFVRSGNWSSVGDLQNTGLVRLPDKRLITKEQFDEGIQRLTGEGEPSVNAEWFQRQIQRDPSWWDQASGAFEGFSRGGAVRGYQAGGAVKAAKATAKNIGELVEKYTPEFKQWFAGSKAATPEGEPLTVYRGATKDEGDVIKNGWFTKDPKLASMFSMKREKVEQLPNSVVTPAHLKMKNPLVVDANGAYWDKIPFGDPRDKMFMTSDQIARFARDEKYDGVIFKNINETDDFFDVDPTDVFVTFNPNQAKSVFNKKPTSDPRLGFASGGLVNGANFPTGDFDPARIESIVGELHALNAG